VTVVSEKSREMGRRLRERVGPRDAAGVEAQPQRLGAQKR
jgi:hypothetical protein